MLFEVIRRRLGRAVPYTRLVGIAVEAIDGRQAVARMAAAGRLRNQVGCVHVGALFTLVDSASGAALTGALADAGLRARCTVVDAHVEYLSSASGEVVARARLAEEASALFEALRRDGHADVAVDARATGRGADGFEVLVARASFNWRVRLRSERGGVRIPADAQRTPP